MAPVASKYQMRQNIRHQNADTSTRNFYQYVLKYFEMTHEAWKISWERNKYQFRLIKKYFMPAINFFSPNAYAPTGIPRADGIQYVWCNHFYYNICRHYKGEFYIFYCRHVLIILCVRYLIFFKYDINSFSLHDQSFDTRDFLVMWQVWLLMLKCATWNWYVVVWCPFWIIFSEFVANRVHYRLWSF